MSNENNKEQTKDTAAKTSTSAGHVQEVNKKGITDRKLKMAWTIVMSIISVVYVLSVLLVFMNSFKSNLYVGQETFKIPTGKMWVGLQNFVTGMNSDKTFPFIKTIWYSLVITLLGTLLILIFTSMAAWYISRVDSIICKIVYYLFAFSMIVPFQMVMYPLGNIARELGMNTPYTLPFVYLGFGAGLACFMFAGFIRSIPLEIEEAAAMDGCGPIRTFFQVVLPMLKPTMISVGILEIMWIWNDYLLPYQTLDRNQYKTIPMFIQGLKGSYGKVDLGATMALVTLSIIPVIVFYLVCQKHIIKGVAAGAVKG